VILPGGLGCITHKLVEILLPQYKERLLGNATVVSVATEKDEVRVHYTAKQTRHRLRKSRICCAPKLIASRLISISPPNKKAAMQHTRYAPYPS